MKSIQLAFVCLASIYCLMAHAADPGTVLVSNVTMIDRDDGSQDVVVNILIRDGSLDVVTEEEISANEAEISVDAQGFVLMGNLSIGEPPSFVITDEDPRQNYEVLLDTKAHVKFAVVRGEIVVNTLAPKIAVAPELEEESPRSGWLSYNPPPMALPLTYHSVKRWNRFETAPISGIFTGAVLLDRQRWLTQDAQSVEQVGSVQYLL
jgi:phosphate-selective porin OprO/OprP